MEPMSLKSLRTADHVRLISLLTSAREKAGLTQQQLADRLGRPQSFVAKYEGGERRIDVIEFLSIARALEFDPARAVREMAAKYGKA
jgi:transcriptional regulator with XRE-family HTH domain